MPKPPDSLLSDDEYVAALDAIVKHTFRDAKPVEQPTATLVGAQPGAGKTTLIASQLLNGLPGTEHAVLIDFMKWSNFHPRFAEFWKIDPQSADFQINKDICALRDDVILHALKVVRCDLMIETWMVLPEKIAQELGYELPEQFVQRMKDFHTFGYKTHLIGLAVNEEVSWQGVLLRDETLRQARGWGQMAPRYFHDALCVVMSEIVELVEKSTEKKNLADAITLCRRGGGVVYENHLGKDGQWMNPTKGRVSLEWERKRPRSVQELAELTENYEKLIEMRTRRNATQDEMGEVQTLLKEARENKLPTREIVPRDGLTVEGIIAAVTEKGVYQERKVLGGSQIIRHDRHSFHPDNVPPVSGKTVVVRYQNRKAEVLSISRQRAKGRSR